ncbi:hypothetical protein, partial [Gallibacterium salpingitidis]|uniref:hypothetical protein n=1 Tax=Gallibacterium salpingitidis TaxID=505341 RepID=UPI00082711BB
APNAKERHIIETWAVANIKLQTKEGNNELKLQTTSTYQDDGVQSAIYSDYDYDGLGSIVLVAENGQNQIQIGNNQETNIIGKVADVYGIDNRSGTVVEMEAGKGNIISIYAPNAKKRTVIKTWNGNTILQTKDGNNELILQTTATNQDSVLNDNGIHRAIDVYNGGSVLLQANNGHNKIQIGDAKNFPNVNGVISAVDGIFSNNATMTMKAGKGNEISIYAPNAQFQGIIYQYTGTKTELLAGSGNNNLTITSELGENREFELVWGDEGKVNLKAGQDNVIKYEGTLNTAIPTRQEELDNNSTFIRGVYAFAKGDVNLEAKNNYVLIKGHGDGLGVGYIPISQNNRYDFYTHGLFASNVKEEGYETADEGFSKIILNAKNGNNVVDITIRSHGEIDGITAQHHGDMKLVATGMNLIRVINPERNTLLMDFGSDSRIYRHGVYSSADSLIELQAKSNWIEIGGNPLIQSGIDVNANAQAHIIADGGDNIVMVKNAVLGSTGVLVVDSDLNSVAATKNNILNLTAIKGTNLIKMYGEQEDWNAVNQSSVLRNRADYEYRIGTIGIYAVNKGSVVTLTGKHNAIIHEVPTNTEFSNINIFADDESQVKLIGSASNTLTGAKIAIQSFNKANVTVDGQMTIDASLWAADARDTGKIALNYEKTSVINGNMLSIGGDIQVKSKGSTLRLVGNEYAYDNGNINLQLTPGSLAVGRMDNFAAYNNEQHKTLFGLTSMDLPAVNSAGQIYLDLAKNSLWKMTGQSWISELLGEGSVDVSPTSVGASVGQALHIDKLSGANRFLMTLNKSGQGSDMLYIKEGIATPQEIVIKNERDVLDSMDYGERLRFATVKSS